MMFMTKAVGCLNFQLVISNSLEYFLSEALLLNKDEGQCNQSQTKCENILF